MAYIAYIQSVVPNNPFRIMVSGWEEAAAARDRLNPEGRIQLIEAADTRAAAEKKPNKPVLMVIVRQDPRKRRDWGGPVKAAVMLDYGEHEAVSVTVLAPSEERAAVAAWELALGDGPPVPAVVNLRMGRNAPLYAVYADGRAEAIPVRLSGSRILEVLYGKSLNFGDLSDRFGRSRSYISKLINEKAIPEPFTMMELAEALGCRLADIGWQKGDVTPTAADVGLLRECKPTRTKAEIKAAMEEKAAAKERAVTEAKAAEAKAAPKAEAPRQEAPKKKPAAKAAPKAAGPAPGKANAKAEVICDYCGKLMLISKWQMKAKKHYCSDACRAADAKTYWCLSCGKKFRRGEAAVREKMAVCLSYRPNQILRFNRPGAVLCSICETELGWLG